MVAMSTVTFCNGVKAYLETLLFQSHAQKRCHFLQRLISFMHFQFSPIWVKRHIWIVSKLFMQDYELVES